MNTHSRLQRLEDARRQAEPLTLRLVFWDDLTPAEQEELTARPPAEPPIVMQWPADEPIRIILDA